MAKVKLKGQATDEQIKTWKDEHEQVFQVIVEESVAYLKKPNRRILSLAMKAAEKNSMRFNETLLNNCWLGGDETIKSDDDKFLAVSSQLDVIVEQKEAEIKEL